MSSSSCIQRITHMQMFVPGSILSVESNQNVESQLNEKRGVQDWKKCGVQNSIWSVDSQENH